jgi:hypothetical protein
MILGFVQMKQTEKLPKGWKENEYKYLESIKTLPMTERMMTILAQS